jgi:outer membrane PBP1 activator LpoA protein
MWQEQFGSKDKKQHMKDMFELTTRVNALVRIATGNVNIAATTALQVGSGAPRYEPRDCVYVWCRWCALHLHCSMLS